MFYYKKNKNIGYVLNINQLKTTILFNKKDINKYIVGQYIMLTINQYKTTMRKKQVEVTEVVGYGKILEIDDNIIILKNIYHPAKSLLAEQYIYENNDEVNIRILN